jgi:hypothetical protein
MTSLVTILFKNPDFFPKVIQLQLSALDFLSYCGGSLGLFLGFSAMSAVEILYYFTLRLIMKRIRSNKTADVVLMEEPVPKQNFVVEFLSNSSIHGCNQIVMEGRRIIER